MKPFRPPAPPRVTRAIIATCVVVQIALTLGGARLDEAVTLAAGLIPARLLGDVLGPPGAVPAALTPVTSLFLHDGWMHLVFNLVFLGWVGRHVEWVFRPTRFLALYLSGGIVGGLLHVAVNPGSIVPVVGASGAVAAVFGAYALMFARSRAPARRVLGIALSAETATALWFGAVWVGLQLLTALALNPGGGAGGIAIWAHIGGFFVGLLVALPRVRMRRSNLES